VVVVDNASWDQSIAEITNLDLPLTIIYNPVNLGFGAACNIGAKNSRADFLLFLNPDTRLFEDSLSRPLAFMTQPRSRRMGIVGVQLLDEYGQISRSCTRFPTPAHFLAKSLGLDRLFPRLFPSHFMTEWDHYDSRNVDHVMGAFFLVRHALFEMLGGFDERFFVYLEDLDFSLRAWQSGWSSFYIAEVQAYHRGGGTSEQVKALRLSYSIHSRVLYSYKHFSWAAATGLLLVTLLLEPLARLGFSVTKGSLVEAKETIHGYFSLWRHFFHCRKV
jgi:GT2 family glycosyltransferase